LAASSRRACFSRLSTCLLPLCLECMAQSGIPALPQPRAGHPLPSGSLYRFRRAERRTRLPGAFSRCSTAVGTTTVHRKRGDGRTGLTLTHRFRFPRGRPEAL
jgi:hypothetical protein